MSKAKFLSASKSDGFGFCSVVFGWDSESAVTSSCSTNNTTHISNPHSRVTNSAAQPRYWVRCYD